MSYQPAAIRQFLIQRFDDEELRHLCFDYFPDVYRDFTLGMRKGQMVQLLLDYCQRRDRLDDLMAALERERPALYDEYFASAAHIPAYKPVAERDPRQVFISHAHEDSQFARRLAADLRTRGWPVWLAPDNIRPGEKWVEAINRGLGESGIFVLVITEAAVQSRWVQSETNVAVELEHQDRLRFIPLLLEPTELPLVWRTYQRIAFHDSYGTGLEALLHELRAQDSQPFIMPPTQPPGQIRGQQRIQRLPRWAWPVIMSLLLTALLLAGMRLDRWQRERDRALGEAALIDRAAAVATAPALTGGELVEDLWPPLLDLPHYQGVLRVGQTVTAALNENNATDTHTWLVPFREDRGRINILLESNDQNELRVYDQNSREWDDYVPWGYRADRNLLTILNAGLRQGNYVISVRNFSGRRSQYSLTVQKAELPEVRLGDTVEGELTGPNPDVYSFRSGPARIDIRLEVEPDLSGELFIIDAEGQEVAYRSAPQGEIVLIENFSVRDGAAYEIIVWNARREHGGDYRLTILNAE